LALKYRVSRKVTAQVTVMCGAYSYSNCWMCWRKYVTKVTCAT